MSAGVTNVLHVTEALGGGVQSAIFNYVHATPEYGHTVFSRGRDGQSTHEWPAEVTHRSYTGNLSGVCRALRRQISSDAPDIVHLHSSFAGVARAFLPGSIPIVYSPHCFAFERVDVATPLRLAFAAAEFVLSRRHQTTLSVSPYEALLSRRLNSRNPVVVALNPSPLRRRVPAGPGGAPARPVSNTVTMVGRLSSQKSPEVFARVAELCRGEGLNFTWIGDGPDGVPERLRSAGVEVSGWQSPEEVERLLGNSMLYLHTAAWEGGPVSAIEAATLGVPVISRSIRSMRSLGYATVGNSPEELADAVRRFRRDEGFRSEVVSRTAAVSRRSTQQQLRTRLREAYELALA